MADIYVATTGSDTTGDGSSGNPYATPGKAGGAASGGDRILIKAGTYVQTSTTSNVAGGVLQPPAGTNAAPTIVKGYNAAVGDLDSVTSFNNFPILQSSAGTGFHSINVLNNHCHFYNIDCDAVGQANRAWFIQAIDSVFVNCRGRNALFYGFDVEATSLLINCLADGNGTNGGAFHISAANCFLISCTAKNNTNAGFFCDSVRCFIIRCLSYNNSGASTDGVITNTGLGLIIINCVIYNNGRDGIRFAIAGGGDGSCIFNNIIYGNAGTGLNSTSTTYTDAAFDYNAFGANGTDRAGVPTGSHDITLSSDPFVNATLGDFRLSANGSSLVGVAFPTAIVPGTVTASLDIGAAQKAASAGTSSLLGIIGFTGGFGE